MPGPLLRVVFSLLGGKGKGVVGLRQPHQLLCSRAQGLSWRSASGRGMLPSSVAEQRVVLVPSFHLPQGCKIRVCPETCTGRVHVESTLCPSPSPRLDLGFGECVTSLGHWKHLIGCNPSGKVTKGRGIVGSQWELLLQPQGRRAVFADM